MTHGEHLAHSISFALIGARKVVRGLWSTLNDAERWAVACGVVSDLKQHGDRWRLNEKMEDPAVDTHSTPRSFTQAHQKPEI
jgi:hypothetical protein